MIVFLTRVSHIWLSNMQTILVSIIFRVVHYLCAMQSCYLRRPKYQPKHLKKAQMKCKNTGGCENDFKLCWVFLFISMCFISNWKHEFGVYGLSGTLSQSTYCIYIWLYIWSSRSGVWATMWMDPDKKTSKFYRKITYILLGSQVWTQRENHPPIHPSSIHYEKKKKLYNSRLLYLIYTFCTLFTHEGCILAPKLYILVLWKSTAPKTAVVPFFSESVWTSSCLTVWNVDSRLEHNYYIRHSQFFVYPISFSGMYTLSIETAM